MIGLSLIYSFCLLFTEYLLKPGTVLGTEAVMMSKIVSLIPQAEETNMNQMVTPTSQDKNKVRKYSEEAPSAMKVFSGDLT